VISLHTPSIDKHRIRLSNEWPGDDTCGAFSIPSHIDRQPMVVIASAEFGWDHVSISRKTRCPTWSEMEQIKRMFFLDTDVVMQLHVGAADHINIHPYCLHLWRPTGGQEIPMPPKELV